ncbi:MAG: T9SS C-terminal target domain-containing protein [Acidobacteria bacterium]|nr:T9SS C-terminal target domain-containing protein [Acidobacteriota bacterium]
MQSIRIAVGLAAAAALSLLPVATVRSDQAPPVAVPGIDKPVVVVTGSIRGTETWVSTNYYVLRGAVFVEDGATLNIGPGTRIIGESGSVGTLVVLQGGRLNAVGTAQAPIVFTSDQPIGRRGRGDWGGLIINGRAPVNLEGGEGEGEGDTGVYGGTTPNDNSGILRYVRVEFSGIEFSPDNELNGIAFQGVGRGTTVEYVQAHMSRDDAMEWFGGTADGKFLVMSNAADDSIDWTFGWSGRLQFVAVTQRGDDADNGIEADNSEFNNNALPRSHPQIYNVTLCGDPDRNEGGESPRAANIRRGTAFTIRNFLVTGFKSVGFQIADANTQAQVDNGTSQLGAGVAWGMPANMHSSVMTYITNGRFPNVRVGVDPGVSTTACSNHEHPNFQPSSIATLAGGQMAPIQPPNDGFFEAVTFIGAVPPAPAHNWTDGWTAFPQN